jgi:hypothetical protein
MKLFILRSFLRIATFVLHLSKYCIYFIFPERQRSHVYGSSPNLMTVIIFSKGRELYCPLSLCLLQSHAISSLLRHPIEMGRSQDEKRKVVIVNKPDNFID